MMDVQYAKKLHGMVWAVRDDLGDKWPTPNTADSLAYAVTEVGEAIDADLRNRRPDDKRNNDRNVSVQHELAQAAMMLLTALGQEWDDAWNSFAGEPIDFDMATIMVISAQSWGWCNSYRSVTEDWTWNIFDALSAIDVYCVGVERYLEEVLQQAREKWG